MNDEYLLAGLLEKMGQRFDTSNASPTELLDVFNAMLKSEQGASFTPALASETMGKLASGELDFAYPPGRGVGIQMSHAPSAPGSERPTSPSLASNWQEMNNRGHRVNTGNDRLARQAGLARLYRVMGHNRPAREALLQINSETYLPDLDTSHYRPNNFSEYPNITTPGERLNRGPSNLPEYISNLVGGVSIRPLETTLQNTSPYFGLGFTQGLGIQPTDVTGRLLASATNRINNQPNDYQSAFFGGPGIGSEPARTPTHLVQPKRVEPAYLSAGVDTLFSPQRTEHLRGLLTEFLNRLEPHFRSNNLNIQNAGQVSSEILSQMQDEGLITDDFTLQQLANVVYRGVETGLKGTGSTD